MAKNDTRIVLTITTSGGKAQTYEGDNLREAATFIAAHSKKAQGVTVAMSRTTRTESYALDRSSGDPDETAAILSDAEAWIAEAQ